MTPLVLRALWLLPLFFGLLWMPGAFAQTDGKVFRIGVLSYRSLEQTRDRWLPTIEVLNASIPAHRFEMVPLFHDELDAAVAAGEFDYVFTQPEHYVLLRSRFGLAALTTLMPLANGRPVTQFGGVIFTRAERTDIDSLAKVAGTRVMGVWEKSLGAYRMQQWELLKAGVHLPDDVASLEFSGQPQDKTVFAVKEGRADVGFVRTGILESLARDKQISLQDFRIINQQPSDGFPQLLSTALYPEWPFAALRSAPESVNKAVALTLLNILPDSKAARLGNYYGFSPPGDYTQLEAVLLRLRVHPGRLDGWDYRDIWEKYGFPLALVLASLLFMALLGMWRLFKDRRRIRQAAHERSLLLRSLGEGVYGVSTEGICTFINPSALNMLGFTQDEVVGKNQHLLFHHHFPDGSDYPRQACPVSQTLQTRQQFRGEEWFFRKSGEIFPVRLNVMPLVNQDRVIGAVVCFQDISAQKKREDEQRIAAVAFETQEGIVISDANNRILRVNASFTQMTGYSAEEAIGQTPSLLKSGRHDAAFYRRMWDELQTQGRWQGEIWNRRKNGEIYPEWLTVTAVRGSEGDIRHYVAAFLDISERKQAEAQLEYMTLYDSLTGLANRRLLQDRLHQALAGLGRSKSFGALLFIDLDSFRHINDTFGYSHGDGVLVEVARRLREELGEAATLARPGGDDFMVLLEVVGSQLAESASHVEHLAEKLLARLSEPYLLDKEECQCTACIGIVLLQDQQVSADDLIKQAELAMYQAKDSGSNAVRFYDPAVQEAVANRMSMEADLRSALKNHELTLYYQPQVNATGDVVGAEALLRWQNPERGMVSPTLFIPFAESSGLILPIGTWVLEQACAQLAQWQRTANLASTWTLAVNISVRQFHQTDFVEQVRSILLQTGADPRRLKLELTESLLVADVEDAVRKMDAIRDLGLSLSLDDFGTGYSSLSYLKRLPLAQLKIDQSFVRDIGQDTSDDTIVRAIIGLAGSLGLEVIAEGVETMGQRDLLLAWGCANYQGFHFYRPMSAGQLTDMLNR
jgi:diguanylate cyclase (GGDEF)-like protein/PAS domain S-box-containing protein